MVAPDSHHTLSLLGTVNGHQRRQLDGSHNERSGPPAEMLLEEEAEHAPDTEDDEIHESAVAALLRL